MDELIKNKRRAQRRKRNIIAKTMRESKQYHGRSIPTKKKHRERISVRDIEQELDDAEQEDLHTKRDILLDGEGVGLRGEGASRQEGTG